MLAAGAKQRAPVRLVGARRVDGRAPSAPSSRRTAPTAPGRFVASPGTAARASRRRTRGRCAGRPPKSPRASASSARADLPDRDPAEDRFALLDLVDLLELSSASSSRPSAIAHRTSSDRSWTSSSVAPSRCITGSAARACSLAAATVAQLHLQLRELVVQHRRLPRSVVVSRERQARARRPRPPRPGRRRSPAGGSATDARRAPCGGPDRRRAPRAGAATRSASARVEGGHDLRPTRRDAGLPSGS